MRKKPILISLVAVMAVAAALVAYNRDKISNYAENRRVIAHTSDDLHKCFGETGKWPTIVESDFDKMPEGMKELGVRGQAGSSGVNTSPSPIVDLNRLGFNALNSWGDRREIGDETLSIYAKLATSKFSYDGREFQIRLPEETGAWINLRGKFVGSNFLRIEGNTLKSLKFLDGDITFAELKTKLAAIVTASMGTEDNDILYGRRGSPDVLTGEEGCDTYLYSSASGDDVFFLHDLAHQESKRPYLNRIVFRFPRGDVFEPNPAPSGEAVQDQVIKFIETKVIGGKTKKYLAGRELVLFDQLAPEARRRPSQLVIQYFGDDGLFEGVPKLRWQQMPLTVDGTEWLVRKCLGEPNETLGPTPTEVDVALENETSNLQISMFFMEPNYDLLIFSDQEVLTHDEATKRMGTCPMPAPPRG